MRFAFNINEKELSVEADVEEIVDKELERRDKKPPRKTKYQIKQEEKRKNDELRHKQQMQYLFVMLGLLVIIIVFCLVASALGIE